jgi:hypothetical protein
VRISVHCVRGIHARRLELCHHLCHHHNVVAYMSTLHD